jgi:sulfatase maturation enzyme AslB (radical SAM superfamily)
VKLSNLKIDFSFIPSLECNIECPFCMYDAGPKRLDILDIEKTIKKCKERNK